MGRVIKPDREGRSTAALTETGKGGLLSKGYLRDDPAEEYVGEGETPVFVVTNADDGVVRVRNGEETAITPGKGYRTIGVVTDRRVIAIVGDAEDGDERVTLPHLEVADARAEDGTLVVEMRSGETWRMYAGDGSIGKVAGYVERVADAWTALEEVLDRVERTLDAAADRRDAEEYEAGIETAQEAYDDLAEAAGLVEELGDDRPVDALCDRVESVRDRCVRTLAAVRVGHGNALADRAEERSRENEFEPAHDAFDRARAEFEAVTALDDDRHDRTDAVAAGLERVETAIEALRERPLERAIDAAQRAEDAEDPAETVAALDRARERYRDALALDEDDPERRFAGEPAELRDRIEAVTDRILATATEEGADALAAGEWYLEADTPKAAREELLVACDVFEDALAVARDARPEDVAEHEELLEDAEAALAAATEAGDLPPADAPVADEGTDSPAAAETDRAGTDEDAVPTGAADDIVTPADNCIDTPADDDTESVTDESGSPVLGRTESSVGDDVDVGADEDTGSPAEATAAPVGTDSTHDAGSDGEGEIEVPDPTTEDQNPSVADGSVPADDGPVPAVDGDGGDDASDGPDPADDEEVRERIQEIPEVHPGDEDDAPNPASERGAAFAASEGAPSEAVAGAETVVSDGAGATAQVPDSPLDVRLRALDPAGFDALAGAVLEEEGWEPDGAPEGALYDLRATPGEDRENDLKVWTIHRPLAGPVDGDQIDGIATLAADDEAAVAVVTSSPTTDDARAVAEEASIELFDRDDVAAVLDGAGPALLDRIRPEPEQ